MTKHVNETLEVNTNDAPQTPAPGDTPAGAPDLTDGQLAELEAEIEDAILGDGDDGDDDLGDDDLSD